MNKHLNLIFFEDLLYIGNYKQIRTTLMTSL